MSPPFLFQIFRRNQPLLLSPTLRPMLPLPRILSPALVSHYLTPLHRLSILTRLVTRAQTNKVLLNKKD